MYNRFSFSRSSSVVTRRRLVNCLVGSGVGESRPRKSASSDRILWLCRTADARSAPGRRPARFRRLSRAIGSYSTHLAFGNFFIASSRIASARANSPISLRNRSPEPSPSVSVLNTRRTLSSSWRSACRFRGTFAERSGSYSDRIAACCIAVAAPRLMRMVRIAFDLGRTPVVRFNQQPGGLTGQRHHRAVVIRLARDQILDTVRNTAECVRPAGGRRPVRPSRTTRP